MRYYKKKNVRYVDMCIWIDENAYKEDCDDEKLFEYLYLLSCMLARKTYWLKTSEDYDSFGIFAATQMYIRYRNPKQSQIKEDGEAVMAPLKSCLNYLKKVFPFIR